MFFIIVFLLLAAIYSFLLNLIPVSNWFLFLWIPLGIILSIITILCFLLLFIRFCNKEKPKGSLRHFLLRNVCFLVFVFLNVKLTIENYDYVPKNAKYVCYANHKSHLDPIALYYALKMKCTVVGKKSLFKNPIMKMVGETFQALPLDRENDREAAKTIIKAIKMVKDGMPMFIFPEGGIKSRDVEEMVDLKAGAYKLATKSDAFILPASIIGTSTFSTRKFFKRMHVKIIFHKPISPSEYSGMNTTMIGEMVANIINEGVKNG